MAAVIFAQHILFAHGHRQQRIASQIAVVVEVLVSERHTERALRHQLLDAVFDQLRIAPIPKAPGQHPRQPQPSIRIPVIDQDQVALALLLVVEELAPVPQVLDEFPVAVDVGVEMAKLPEQGALGLGVARVECAQLGVEQVVEEERRILGAVGGRHRWIKPPPLLGFLA